MFGFNDPFLRMNSIMNQMMMDPFAPSGQRRQNNQLANRHNDPFSSMLMAHQSPFSMMNSMMGNFEGNILRNFQHMSNDPNAQVYSSSSVVSYSNTGDGAPKIFQQTKHIKQGPGGVKETREMIRDSERGVEKVAIGHHIGDRAHIIERQRKNGQMEEIVNLENLDDEEVQAFNDEFESRVNSNLRSSHKDFSRRHHHLNNSQPLAIEDNKSKRDKDRKQKSKSKSRF